MTVYFYHRLHRHFDFLAVNSFVSQGVESVSNGNDAGVVTNLILLQILRVTIAIRSFMILKTISFKYRDMCFCYGLTG